MASSIHGFIADLLAGRGIRDPDDYAGRVATALDDLDQPSVSEIKAVMNKTRTGLFQMNAGHKKRDTIEWLASRVASSPQSRRQSKGPSLTSRCQVLLIGASPFDPDYLQLNDELRKVLQLDEEFREIQQLQRGASGEARMEFVSKAAARPDDLLQAVNDLSPAIVHFSGHGNTSGVALAKNNRESVLLDCSLLRDVMAQFRPAPRVVLLNSCHSDDCAKSLLDSVQCVIGTTREVTDSEAATFAGAFYRAIASGRSVADAHGQGDWKLRSTNAGSAGLMKLRVRNGNSADRIVLLAD